MYGKTKRDRILFCILLGLLGAALAGSVWAWVGASECGGCRAARDLVSGRSLAPAGVGLYAGLLALGALFGRSRILFSGLLLAAGAHAVLLTLLVLRGSFCGPCTLIGAAAILGATLSFFMDPENLARGSVLMPVGAILMHAALFLVAAFPESGGQPAFVEPPEPTATRDRECTRGTATLLVFTRAGCRYCEEFEEQVLPGLVREFGVALGIERRTAPAGIPSPTIVVSGAQRTVFPGLPPTLELRDAIVLALGKGSHEPTLFSESR